MGKAEGLLKRISEDLKELNSLGKALPKSDQEKLGGIVSSFESFSKSLESEPEEKQVKTVGVIPFGAKSDSEMI